MSKIKTDLIQNSKSGSEDVPVIIGINSNGTDMSGAQVAVDGVVATDLIQQPATGGARSVPVAIVVNPDGSPINGGGGGEGGPVLWDSILGKPEIIASGATEEEARMSIGAGTSNLQLGTTATTALRGDTNWDNIPGRPAVIAAGATEQEARESIGALAADMVGAANGVAPLDSSGSIPIEYLNVSGLTFKGPWNPVTNEPELINGEGNLGEFYKATEEGSYDFGTGLYTFNPGDWVIFADDVWQRIGTKDSVAAVNGKTGMVNLTADDVGAKPATYVPSWSEIVGRPESRGQIGAPIPAVHRRAAIAQVIPSNTVTELACWTGAGYDSFNMTSDGNRFTVPSWASFARVSISVGVSRMPTGSTLWGRITMGSFNRAYNHSVAYNHLTGVLVFVQSGIVPVNAGDTIYASLQHNNTTDMTIDISSSSYINIELFEFLG